MDIQIGKVYRNFKGNYYYVENIARNSETQEDYVVYRPLYTREDASLWIRPLSMFLEKIDASRPDKIKELAGEMGYAKEVKEYKANPENYPGHVGDISTVLRVSLTKRANTPDLYEIMQVLGKERITKRYEKN